MLVKSVLGGLGLGLLLAWAPAWGQIQDLPPLPPPPGPSSGSARQDAAASCSAARFHNASQKCACADRRGTGAAAGCKPAEHDDSSHARPSSDWPAGGDRALL